MLGSSLVQVKWEGPADGLDANSSDIGVDGVLLVASLGRVADTGQATDLPLVGADSNFVQEAYGGDGVARTVASAVAVPY